jgi:hypothetical protein
VPVLSQFGTVLLAEKGSRALPYGGRLIPLADAADELFAAAVRLKEKALLPGFSTEEILRIAGAVEEALRRCCEVARETAEHEFAEEWEFDD